MKKSVAAWIALGLITVIAGLLLAITNEVTKGTIEAQAAESKIEARKSVLPTAAEFEVLELEELQPLEDLYTGTSGEEVAGYVGTVITREGYGGPIEVIAGVDAQGKVTGVSVGGSEFSETAGLGSKAKEPAFMQQFIGKQTPVRAVKSAQDRGDNTIDAITAATKTTNAVVGAVNAIAAKVDGYLNPETDAGAAEGTTYTASAQGFAGPVAVLVTVKDDGTISALTVGDDQFAETDGYGARAKDATFTKQFVGKSLPLTIDDIDALSGATRTSVAVVDAINKAFEDKVVVAPPAPEGTRYTASEQGFAGPVAVYVTVKDDGTITALSIGDDQFKETDGYGAAAKEPAFIKQFTGKQLPLTMESIDALSGATRTTTAVVNAINRAYEEKLEDLAGEQTTAEALAATAAPAATESPVATEAPVEEAPAADGKTATASVEGFMGPVAVTITLNEDDTLATVVVGDAQFSETEGLGSKAKDEAFTSQFVGKKLPLTVEDIDVIAGATVTSKAVVDAINAAYETLDAPAEEAADAQTATASVEGFMGPVAVTITLNDDDTLAKVEVGDAQFSETEGLGSKAKDEEFTSQFAGKKLPLAVEDIDVIAGATVTSKAVVDAINAAYETLTK